MTQANHEKGPGQALKEKWKADPDMIQAQNAKDPGEARTAKGKAYEELLRREIEAGEVKPKK